MAIDENRHRTGKPHDVGIGHPCSASGDYLVAGIAAGEHDLFGAASNGDLVDVIVEGLSRESF
ncbi:hypothetical protein [Phyllobacterium endophyticum]|uniref:hypothetical protein n=1 Tax=Phyllobacterium endophyticum TaxID=1149773 RepID=UPI001650CA6F|nr:hypothetical protein [Phyllobacterium endophyticum]